MLCISSCCVQNDSTESWSRQWLLLTRAKTGLRLTSLPIHLPSRQHHFRYKFKKASGPGKCRKHSMGILDLVENSVENLPVQINVSVSFGLACQPLTVGCVNATPSGSILDLDVIPRPLRPDAIECKPLWLYSYLVTNLIKTIWCYWAALLWKVRNCALTKAQPLCDEEFSVLPVQNINAKFRCFTAKSGAHYACLVISSLGEGAQNRTTKEFWLNSVFALFSKREGN